MSLIRFVGAVGGAAIGGAIGGPAGAWKGFQIGSAASGILEGFLNRPDAGGSLGDLNVQTASPGAFIPIVFNTWRLAGAVVWAPDLHEYEGGSGGKLKGMPSAPTRTMDAAFLICEGPVTRINKWWADSDLVYDYNGGTEKWAEYIVEDAQTFYLGTDDQDVDPLIEAERTAAGDEAPAYVLRALHVTEEFPWSRYGHDPNMTYEVIRNHSGGAYSLGQILHELFTGKDPDGNDVLGDRLRLPEAWVDFSALMDVPVEGFAVMSREELVASVAALLQAKSCDVVEVDGVLTGVKRVQSATFTLEEEWLGMSDAASPEVTVERNAANDLELPRSLEVFYLNKDNDFQRDVQHSIRPTVAGQGSETVEAPLVMTPTEARRLAFVLHAERYQYADPFDVHVGPRDLKIAPGDVGTITVRGRTRTVRAIGEEVDPLGVTTIKLVRYDSSIYTQTVEGSGSGSGSDVIVPGQVYCEVRDLNALNDGDADYPTLYAVMSRSGGIWPGGEVTVAPDDVNDWRNYPQVYPWTNISRRAVMGVCDTVLPDGAYGVWDEVSTVDVTLVQGELVTRSESAVLRGLNLCVIGDEILQFKTATLLAPGQYRLSGLIRGRRGTEWAIPAHGADEPFWLADGAEEAFWPAFSQVGRELDFTGRVIGVDVTKPGGVAAAVTETIEGKARKPYSPCMVAATRDAFGAITLTWQRRARKNGVPSGWSVPLDESSELYEVDILDGPGGDVVRTISASVETATYGDMEQVADFGTVQDPCHVVVYQVSPVIGRGFGRAASI